MTTLHHHNERDALVLTPDGSIDAGDVPALLATAARLVDDDSRGTVVLDLSLLRSGGLAAVDAVLRLHLIARRCGRPLLIRHTPVPLERALELTGLRDILPRREACSCRGCTEW